MRHTAALWPLVIATLATCTAQAGDGSISNSTLASLSGVYVAINGFSSAQQNAGFNKELFRNDVEERLRTHGIPVLDAAESTDHSLLALEISPPDAGEVTPFYVRLEMLQEVTLSRDPEHSVFEAPTWSVTLVGQGDVENARDLVRLALDHFILSWKSAHRKM